MVLEVLLQILRKKEVTLTVDTYIMGGAKSPSHLIFADDLLLFFKANIESIRTLKKILSNFSGLISNKEIKSSLFFSLSIMQGTWLQFSSTQLKNYYLFFLRCH